MYDELAACRFSRQSQPTHKYIRGNTKERASSWFLSVSWIVLYSPVYSNTVFIRSPFACTYYTWFFFVNFIFFSSIVALSLFSHACFLKLAERIYYIKREKKKTKEEKLKEGKGIEKKNRAEEKEETGAPSKRWTPAEVSDFKEADRSRLNYVQLRKTVNSLKVSFRLSLSLVLSSSFVCSQVRAAGLAHFSPSLAWLVVERLTSRPTTLEYRTCGLNLYCHWFGSSLFKQSKRAKDSPRLSWTFIQTRSGIGMRR